MHFGCGGCAGPAAVELSSFFLTLGGLALADEVGAGAQSWLAKSSSRDLKVRRAGTSLRLDSGVGWALNCRLGVQVAICAVSIR